MATQTAEARGTTAFQQYREAVGDWEVEPAHTTVGFTTRYLRFTKVRGTIPGVTGTVHIAEDPAGSWVDVTLETATIDTGNRQRDGHLRSPEFFDVERYPTIHFRATRGEPIDDRRLRVCGELTMHGVTRPVELEAEFHGVVRDPFGRDKAIASATATVDREQWGLTWNQALETGGFLVSKDVELEIEAQFVRKQG